MERYNGPRGPVSYLTMVKFCSHEEAMKNSRDPTTSEFAERMATLCDGPLVFHSLDIARGRGCPLRPGVTFELSNTDQPGAVWHPTRDARVAPQAVIKDKGALTCSHEAAPGVLLFGQGFVSYFRTGCQ